MVNHTAQNQPVLEFADCIVDPNRREVSVCGALITIEPKVFDLLIYLIDNRDRAIGKEELQDQIWPGVIVTEAALTRCVMKARRAVGDEGRQKRIIKTVHGHGYRFVATLVDNLQFPMTISTESVGKPSVAVLPFSNLSDDPRQEYFSDGITEDIITEISRFKSLDVTARHSSFVYKGKRRNATDIGTELGVGYLVDGSVQKAANRIRINARLTDATTGNQLWADRYDRELNDILVIQDEVAGMVAATINGRVEASRGRKPVPDNTLIAYDHILRAQALYYKVDKQSNAAARIHLEKALSADKDNPRALGLLAAVHSIDSWSFWSEDPDLSQRLSRELGSRSIELDDTDSLIHGLYGEILFDFEEYERAESHFHKALTLNHNDIAARALFASKLAAMGRVDEALAHLAYCESRDPFGLVWLPWIKATVLLSARRFEESVTAFRMLDNPPNAARLEHASALAQAGQTAAAQNMLGQFLRIARQEMPSYPGDEFGDWSPLLSRFIDFQNPEDRANFELTLQSIWI